MKKDMPLEGLRWSRDSGSALYDTPQTAVLGRAGGQISNIELMIGSMCKICVSLFAILTGWVLYLNPKFKSYSYNFRKAKSFILNYWIAELIFIIVRFMFCLKLPSFSILLANLFGFETGAYEIMGYDYVKPVGGISLAHI